MCDHSERERERERRGNDKPEKESSDYRIRQIERERKRQREKEKHRDREPVVLTCPAVTNKQMHAPSETFLEYTGVCVGVCASVQRGRRV